MKQFTNKQYGIGAIIAGIIIYGIGNIISLADIFSLYGKASATSACMNANGNCSITTNVLLSYIGKIVVYAGLGVTVVGLIILIRSTRRGKK